MEYAALTITQLNEYIHGLLQHDPLLRDLRVEGEISGFKKHSSGHLYFSLKDANALVRCVMFRTSAQALQFQPQDGMRVLVTADASLYVRDGQFQLYINAMQPQGEGELYRRFLLLKTKLAAKGYFAAERKRTIPFLPGTVGIITSGSGAALQDMLQIAGRRFPRMDMAVCPVQVQGIGSAEEIAAAIGLMNAERSADVLIVGRGGGRMEDLWAFNEECVARAIFESKIPVISAVGHETDVTIADFVADLRAPTPSAAIELCVPEYAALMQHIDTLAQRLPFAVTQNVHMKMERVQLLLQRREFHKVENAAGHYRMMTDALQKRLANAVNIEIASKRSMVEQLLARGQSLSPEQMLLRGYAFLTDGDGGLIKEAAQLHKDMPVEITLQGGYADAVIRAVHEK